MASLLESIKSMIDNVSVTDRQEESIETSTNNLNDHLTDDENKLDVESTFVNGSYERDTIIRPLDDVDIFAVLNRSEWEDEYGNLPSPQSVLTKIKNKLNSIVEYKDKVSQDRPCVTIKLSDKNFDVLPSFEEFGGGYKIPNYDLETWTYSYPEKLSEDLKTCHRTNDYKIKQIVKVIKYWNREKNKKRIPSYHIEETIIEYFNVYSITNFEDGIRNWFNNAESYLRKSSFNTDNKYDDSIKKIKKAKEKINEAHDLNNDNKTEEAKKLWKEVFGREFPIADKEEAKSFGKKLSEGNLKVSSSRALSSSIGRNIPSSKGFYGEISD